METFELGKKPPIEIEPNNAEAFFNEVAERVVTREELKDAVSKFYEQGGHIEHRSIGELSHMIDIAITRKDESTVPALLQRSVLTIIQIQEIESMSDVWNKKSPVTQMTEQIRKKRKRSREH